MNDHDEWRDSYDFQTFKVYVSFEQRIGFVIANLFFCDDNHIPGKGPQISLRFADFLTADQQCKKMFPVFDQVTKLKGA